MQIALGNAQTIVAFRISRADAEALSRVLGEVNTKAIKHKSSSSYNPLYSPLSEQWEEFVQFLTRQPVRQAVVKTADDRLAVVWPEMVKDGGCSAEQLEQVIVGSLSKHGQPFQAVFQSLVSNAEEQKRETIFSY